MVSLPLPPLMRSSPSPPEIRSSPDPPSMRSSSSPPRMMSSSRPPSIRSSPDPPRMMSEPLPPLTRSSPLPAMMMSSPLSPRTRSLPLPERMMSSPRPPRTRSSPPPDIMKSSPSRPSMRSRLPVPKRKSLRFVPRILAIIFRPLLSVNALVSRRSPTPCHHARPAELLSTGVLQPPISAPQHGRGPVGPSDWNLQLPDDRSGHCPKLAEAQSGHAPVGTSVTCHPHIHWSGDFGIPGRRPFPIARPSICPGPNNCKGFFAYAVNTSL